MTVGNFPASPVPAWHGYFTWPTDHKNGIFYPGDTVTMTLSKSGATDYEVRNYVGTIVSSGSISGTTVTPAPPVGGWDCGWYRLYATGPNTDTNDPSFGNSYGATNFVVIRDTPGFMRNNPDGEPIQGGDDSRNIPARAVLGIGSTRTVIGNVSLCDADNPYYPGVAPGTGYCGNGMYTALYDAQQFVRFWRDDPVRPCETTCSIPYRTYDQLDISGIRFYCKTGSLNGSQVFVAAGPGSSSGYKVTVSYPDAGTVVETYDNVANGTAMVTAINAASNYLKVFGGGGAITTTAATAIGNAFYNGVVTLVTYLYPHIKRFDGPSNEPTINAEAAHCMMLFQAAVHAGHPDAKAIGPCSINLVQDWAAFAAADGFDYCDELSVHAYNFCTNGDLNLGRSRMEAFMSEMRTYGQEDKPVWVTESTHVFTSVYRIHHPRRSRVPLLQTLLMEQYGIPKERNQVWYDNSHGFWSYPAWLWNDDGSCVPYAAMYRTLSEELYGTTHHHAIDFGSDAANRIALGSVYSSVGGSVAVMQLTSHMDDCTVTLAVSGSDNDLTVVDAWGNESSVSVSGGLAVVPLADIPTYVRLPVGVFVRVAEFRDWGAIDWSDPMRSISPLASATFSGASSPLIGDQSWQTSYGVGVARASATTPDTAELVWTENIDVDRVIVWCGQTWQPWSTLLDFDVQTYDGATWTTRATVTNDTASSFVFGTDYHNAGCWRETYFNEQWVYDVKLPATYSALGVRIYARETSYGGEPDHVSGDGQGQGDSNQHLTIQEIVVPSASTPAQLAGSYPEEVLADTPVGYWRLGNWTGTSFPSEVNALHTTGGVTPTYVEGAISGDYGVRALGNPATPNSALLNVGDVFTVEFWWKNIDNYSNSFPVAAGYWFSFRVGVAKQPYLGLWMSGDNSQLTDPIVRASDAAYAAIANDGNWHYIVVTKNGATANFYVDGEDVTQTGTNKTLSSTNHSVGFGYFDSGQCLDEVAIYNYALSAERVAVHYASSTTKTAVPTNTLAPMLQA
jgi:hypothetical protein